MKPREVITISKEDKRAQPPTGAEAVDEKLLAEGPKKAQEAAEKKAKEAKKNS